MKKTKSPPWPQVGDRVAIFTTGNTTRVELGIVESVTTSRVILEGGDRYRRDTLRPIGNSTSFNYVELRPVNDPAIQRYRLWQYMRRLQKQIEVELLPGNPSDQDKDVDYCRARLANVEKLVATAFADFARIMTQK
jgi:hypothetical protein